MGIEFVLIITGFMVLVKSADLFVEGAVVLAKKLHVEEVVIGVTLVALGTSLPELFVNFSARKRELDDVLVGNVLGSCLFNLLMILGLQVSIRPLLNISRKLISFDLPLALLLVVLSWVFFISPFKGVPSVSTWEGVVLSALYLLFILKQYRDFRARKAVPPVGDPVLGREPSETQGGWTQRYFYLSILLGIVGLYLGSELTVENSAMLARKFHLSEAFIGVFILSVGTSLPELMTCIVALHKNYDRLALGNVLGSNICNIGIVLALFSWFSPIRYNSQFDVTFMVLLSLTGYLLISLLLKKQKKISRIEGIIMVLSYAIYAGYSYYQGL